jgi:hypothetical protein
MMGRDMEGWMRSLDEMDKKVESKLAQNWDI